MSLAETIESSLEKELRPSHIEVVDESHTHNVPPGSESHFKVVVVSDAFEGKPLIARHRIVNAIVDMGKLGIHALALHTFTKAEWQIDDPLSESPDCLGGA